MSLHIRPISPFAHPGMPLIYDSCWDYGGGILGSVWRLEYQVMLTQGTLSDPSASAVDDNDSGQLVARLGIVPFTGALVRLSWARGAYLNNAVSESLATGAEVEDFNQKIAGVAVEYEIRHLVVVAEWARNRWESPFIVDAGGGAEDLEVTGSYLEARYKLAPGLYVAGRYSALHFGDPPRRFSRVECVCAVDDRRRAGDYRHIDWVRHSAREGGAASSAALLPRPISGGPRHGHSVLSAGERRHIHRRGFAPLSCVAWPFGPTASPRCQRLA